MGSCTVFFDGRFWIALAERRGDDGSVSIARHVFGPEPSNPELLRFYLDDLARLRFTPALEAPRARPRKEAARDGGRARKALDAYKESRRAELDARKPEVRALARASREERRLAKREKRKKRRNG